MSPDLAPVSVIVPAYRAAKTIERALKSIAGQTLLPREVVVVDDGSDDATAATAQACETMLNPISLTVISQPSGGAGAARNRGILAASQSILAFLDADDEWLPDHLKDSLDHMSASGCTLTAHNEWLVDGDQEWLNDSISRLREWSDPFVSIYRKGCISTSTVVVGRDAVIDAGGFDSSLLNGQDVDLWLAILSAPSARLVGFEKPLSRYFISPEGINAKTARRLHFFLKIANRWAPEIAKRPSGGMRALWFRISAIHLEAVRSFVKSGSYGHAAWACLCFPFSFARITCSGMAGRGKAPRDFLTCPDLQSTETPCKSRQ
jgi:glycosyltransferase involved in cell wall biosynthesis